ncbi:reverse transcriptase domain-containing protein [Tanacetum coccineum]
MPVWCKMFCQTLRGAAQNWFDDLDPKSLDSFEELSQKLLEEFSQQKRYTKDSTEIHDCKRRQNEGLQPFMDRFRFKSLHIKGVPPVLHISAFMHGHGHSELAKLNDKIPKTVDEMFERVRAFIKGEVSTGSAEMVRRILVDGGSSSEIMYEHCFKILNVNIQSRLKRCRAQLVGFSGEMYHPLGIIDLRVTMGKAGRNKTVLMEFAIIKCRSPYNVIIGQTRMRSLRAVGSTIHSMIKFPTNQGIVTMETSREALWECKHLERVQGPMPLEKTRDRENTEEVFTINHERLNQYVTMGTTLITDYKRLLTDVLWKNMEVFQWLKEGMIRKVQPPVWVANTIPVKLGNGTCKVQVDYFSLNKICAKEMYPFLEEGEELASIMRYPYKCFLRLPKEYNQRMMEKVLADQRGRNIEIYLEEIVTKSKNKQDLVQDVEETLRKLKRVDIKIDPIMYSFELKDGRFLGHMVRSHHQYSGEAGVSKDAPGRAKGVLSYFQLGDEGQLRRKQVDPDIHYR